MNVDIIIIGYNNPEMDSSCIKEVIKNTDYPYKITYFDNYQSGYTLTQVWNKLIKSSKSEYICLLNNDAFPTKHWLVKLMHSLLEKKSMGFIGPSTNSCHTIQSSVTSEEAAEMFSETVIELDKHLSGFCLLFPRAIWKKLNGFDESYTLYGQESDFIQRAKKLGYKCWWRKDVFVYHLGEATSKKFNIDVEEERKKAKHLYKYKELSEFSKKLK